MDYILITNLMHQLLFIHKIIFSSTCFEPQVLIFRRIQLYTCSIWYCQSLWEFLVAFRYTAWVRTDCRGKFVGRASSNNSPAAFTPGEIPGTHFSEAESTSGQMVLSGVPRKKSPVTSPGIDPGTVRLVAQRLNHYATQGPFIRV